MTLLFVRVFFLIISTFVGFYIGSFTQNYLLGAGMGCGSGFVLIFVETSLRRVSVRGLSSMVFGLMLGVLLAKLVSDILSLLPLGEFVHSISRVIFTLIFSYLGAVMALRGKSEFHLIIPYVRFKRQDVDDRLTLLDTSAVIDGRVADLYKTNFFGGQLMVPRFVLKELQALSDSDNPVKRQKGRRGIEILRNMQKDSSMDIRIYEDDIPAEQDVDAKLVKLAKITDAKIFTTDYNLSRVATIQGVEIYNINELINAVKPVFFPGEELDVRLIKEGKEANQAVAYTDDGTMIVVSDGRKYIGKKVKVNIASVLQTQAGKMIFAKIKNVI